MIIQGTTPIIKFTLSGIAHSNISSLHLMLKNNENLIADKSTYEYDEDSGIYEVKLTQYDTLKMQVGRIVAQVRVKTIDGNVYASMPQSVQTEIGLSKEVI